MAKLHLRESDFGYKSGDRYYGGLPAEPEYDGPPKRARYWKELHQYFKEKVREYPEYYVIGTSPTAITLKTPDGKETIDLTKFDALSDAEEAIEMASHYFDESLFEAKKKKKNGALVNPDAGNVEHNVAMFNKMNSPVDGPSNNPVSGPFGGDVSCAESLEEARDPYFTPYGYKDAAKVLNGKAPEYYYHLKEIEMDRGDGEKLARYARKIGLPVVQDPDDDPDYPTFYILGKYHWNDYFYPYPSSWEPKVDECLTEGNNVSSQLTPALDSFLQDIAQMYGTISYKDIMEHNYTAEDIKKLSSLRRKFRAEVQYEGNEEADATLNKIAEDVANIVKSAPVDEAAEDVGKATEYIVLKKWNSDILRNRKCWYPRMYAVLRRNERGAWIRAHGFAEDTFVPERDIVASYDNYEDADKHLCSLDDIIYEGLNEAAPKKETIELEYKNLEFTQYGTQRDVDDWDEWDRCMDWTYEVDKDDLYTFIFESCIDEIDFPPAFEDDFDPNNAEDWSKFESWLDANFDTIYSKYEEKILENWEEDAAEEAAQDYDPDDYVDWDSMPGGHDDDRYWEDLNECEEVFMEKYPTGLTEEYKREPRMTDYFEQMNSEEDEA